MDIMEMERTAREAMADGDLKKSRDIYNKLIELMPQNPSISLTSVKSTRGWVTQQRPRDAGQRRRHS